MNLTSTEKQTVINILSEKVEALKKKNIHGQASFIENIIEKIKD